MKTKNIKQWTDINASIHDVFEALMDSKKHSKFTGSKAHIGRKVGEGFSVWGGDIQGVNLEIEPDKKIVQSWRSSDWPENHFSKVTFKFKEKNGKTRILFWQSGIPEEFVSDIEQGWKEYYWEPLKSFF